MDLRADGEKNLSFLGHGFDLAEVVATLSLATSCGVLASRTAG